MTRGRETQRDAFGVFPENAAGARAGQKLAARGTEAILRALNDDISTLLESDGRVDWLLILAADHPFDPHAEQSRILLNGTHGEEPAVLAQQALHAEYGSRLHWVGFRAGVLAVDAQHHMTQAA